MGIRRILKFSASLFDFKNLDAILRDEAQKGRLPSGVTRYFIGILLALFTSFALTTLAIVYLIATYNATVDTSLVATPRPAITTGFLISSVIYFGLVTFPFLFFGTFLHQGVVYLLMRLLGGRGSFAQQYSITSYITFALGFGSLGFIPIAVLGLLLPCFNLFFLLIYLAALAYLALFVQTRMMVQVHKVPFMSALLVSVLITAGSFAAYALLELALMKAGLAPDFTATYSLVGINSSSLGVNMTGLPQLGPIPNISSNMTVISGLVNSTNLTNTTG